MKRCHVVILFAWLAFTARVGAVDYAAQIKPLLKQKCYACHGALKQEAGLRLDTVELMLKGGESGSAAELIIERVRATEEHERMPQEAAALTAEQIAMLRTWIDAGVPGIANEAPEADPKQHWAFQAVQRPPVPKSGGGNAIDGFVNEVLAANQLAPLPEAPRSTQLRRVYLDLIGLPPTRGELQAFLGDSSPVAYERVVDRLLNDPRHGERWGRHWMDVWRYSDWYGRRTANDVWNSAPQIWRWRDWIVKSLNADKGYDRMLSEMLAADEIAPLDDEAAVATGFLIRNWYALNPNQWMRDTIEHTGKAFLGLTFNCAHCHDHKYDPISHEDYFRLRAFFEPMGIRQDRVVGEADPGPFQEYEYVKLRKPNRLGAVRVVDKTPDAKTWFYTGGDERNRVESKGPLTPGVPAFLGSLSIQPVSLPQGSVHPGLRPAIQETELMQRLDAVTKAEEELLALSTPKARAALTAARAEMASSIARIAADQAKVGGSPEASMLARKAAVAEREAAVATAQSALMNAEHAVTLADEKGREAATKAVTAAKADLTKAEAERDKPKSPDSYTSMTMSFPNQSTGRRKALAEWLTQRDHPLTARVAVNHLWMRHFQEPLVSTVFDFGRNGKPPTHPLLLDWLAAELMENGWSMKHLHRLIVTSAAYRRASSNPKSEIRNQQSIDPDNRFLWRMNPSRMEAEVVRDSVLHLAGALDATFGGQELENTESETSTRRSLYFSCHPETGGRSAMAAMFDAPEPTDCYRRSRSVLPQQALVLTNSKLVHNHSAAMVRQIGQDAPDFVTAAFEHVLSRPPTADELTSCRDFLMDGSKESLVRVLLNHNDFVTVR
jgi:mono/diheme cytochrome c family protein